MGSPIDIRIICFRWLPSSGDDCKLLILQSGINGTSGTIANRPYVYCTSATKVFVNSSRFRSSIENAWTTMSHSNITPDSLKAAHDTLSPATSAATPTQPPGAAIAERPRPNSTRRHHEPPEGQQTIFYCQTVDADAVIRAEAKEVRDSAGSQCTV